MHWPQGPVFLRLLRYRLPNVPSVGNSGSGHGCRFSAGIGGGSHTGERTSKVLQAVSRHDANRIGKARIFGDIGLPSDIDFLRDRFGLGFPRVIGGLHVRDVLLRRFHRERILRRELGISLRLRRLQRRHRSVRRLIALVKRVRAEGGSEPERADEPDNQRAQLITFVSSNVITRSRTSRIFGAAVRYSSFNCLSSVSTAPVAGPSCSPRLPTSFDAARNFT